MKEDIIKIFKKHMPTSFKYHEKSISKIIDYMIESEKLGERGNYWVLLSYENHIEMKNMSEICEEIKKRFIDNKEDMTGFSLMKREPKNDYERGLFDSIGMIYHIQHCMNPG